MGSGPRLTMAAMRAQLGAVEAPETRLMPRPAGAVREGEESTHDTASSSHRKWPDPYASTTCGAVMARHAESVGREEEDERA
jgi:hypothetical protein